MAQKVTPTHVTNSTTTTTTMHGPVRKYSTSISQTIRDDSLPYLSQERRGSRYHHHRHHNDDDDDYDYRSRSRSPEHYNNNDGGNRYYDYYHCKENDELNMKRVPIRTGGVTTRYNENNLPPFRTVLMPNLSPDVTHEQIYDFFSDIGRIVGLNLTSAGTAFVKFASRLEALDAIRKKCGKFLGNKPVLVKASGTELRHMALENRWRSPLSARDEHCKTIYVGNIGTTYTEYEIKNLFASVGKVLKVIPVINKTGNIADAAFVEFETEDGPIKATKLNGSLYENRRIRVDYFDIDRKNRKLKQPQQKENRYLSREDDDEIKVKEEGEEHALHGPFLVPCSHQSPVYSQQEPSHVYNSLTQQQQPFTQYSPYSYYKSTDAPSSSPSEQTTATFSPPSHQPVQIKTEPIESSHEKVTKALADAAKAVAAIQNKPIDEILQAWFRIQMIIQKQVTSVQLQEFISTYQQ